MLERQRRIHTARDHRGVWRGGRVIRGRTIVLRYAPTKSVASRFGFVVSSSVAKRATVRNLIKRRLRAIAGAVAMPKPYDIVAYATKAATTATFQDLRSDFTQLLDTLHAPPPHRHH